MTVNHYSNPWNFFTVSNLINEDELFFIRKQLEIIGSDEKAYKENGLRLNMPIQTNSEIYKTVTPKFIELCNKVSTLDSNKEEIVVEASIIKPGFNYTIHNDRYTKTLSFVLHISEYGHGTRLYENVEGSGNRVTMEWIPGGGGGFIRQDKHWHSFDTLEDSTTRYTLLLTKRTREDKALQDKTFPLL